MRPALRRASRPHHLVRGLGGRGSTGGSVVQSRRALAHLPVADGRRSGASTAAALWCAGVACACGTMRASACATAKVLVARQHAVSVPNRSTVHGCGQGEAPDHACAAGAAACSRRARFATPSRGVLAFGRGQKQRAAVTPRATRGWSGGCYVHAEGSRATSQGCGEVADMRGSHNDATLAS